MRHLTTHNLGCTCGALSTVEKSCCFNFHFSEYTPLELSILPHCSISLRFQSLSLFQNFSSTFPSSSCATTHHHRTKFTSVTPDILLNCTNENHSFISDLHYKKLISILCRFPHLLLFELPSYFSCVLCFI